MEVLTGNHGFLWSIFQQAMFDYRRVTKSVSDPTQLSSLEDLEEYNSNTLPVIMIILIVLAVVTSLVIIIKKDCSKYNQVITSKNLKVRMQE